MSVAETRRRDAGGPAGGTPALRLVKSVCLAFALCFLAIRAARASDMSVDRRTLQPEETLQITVALTGSFASLDTLNLPLRNLEVDGAPSTSSMFSFVNGETSRSKTFTFTAHALGAGPALVGPLVLSDGNGHTETLAPIAVQVLPDAASQSTDPLRIVHELRATGRDPIFLLAEADRTSAWVGEEIVVTWYLYAGINVDDFRIESVPPMPDFWSEALDVKDEAAQQVVLDGITLQKVPIRRVALFSLRSGALQIGSLRTMATTVKQTSAPSPFSPFEGNAVTLRQRSPRLSMSVNALPAGMAADAIGELAMHCGTPAQNLSGPVRFDVKLTGRGNLRSARAPHLEGAPAAAVEVSALGVTSERAARSLTMTRAWRFVLFPERDGPLAVPPVIIDVFNPRTGAREQLRCAASTLPARSVDRPAAVTPAQGSDEKTSSTGAWALIGVAGAIFAAILAVILVGRRARRRAIEDLLGDGSVTSIRARIDKRIRPATSEALLREASDLGDAYRGVRSLLDVLERDAVSTPETISELRERLAELESVVARKAAVPRRR